MIPSEIINDARLESSATIDIVTQTQAFTLLNKIETDFWRDMSNDSTGDKMTLFNIDLVAGQSTYTLPQSIPASTLLTTTFGINQVVKAGIKLNSLDKYYTPVAVKYVEWFLNMNDFYATQTPMSWPIAYLIWTDNIVIFPTPTISMTAGLQLMWPKATVAKSESTEDVEWMILVPADCHNILIEWLKWKFWARMGVNFKDTALQQKQYYESEKLRVINQWSNKNILADSSFIPDLSFLG